MAKGGQNQFSGAAEELKLDVETQWGSRSFKLVPGKSIQVGRSPEADVLIADSSVSLFHLKITWTGEDLKLRDLNSSNGTFRLPQNSPFLEARLPPKSESIELLLSKTKISIRWALLKPEVNEDKTQVLPSVDSKTTPAPGKPSKQKSKMPLSSQNEIKKPGVKKAMPIFASQQSLNPMALVFDLRVLSSIFLTLAFFIFTHVNSRSFLYSKDLPHNSGMAVDLMVLSMKIFSSGFGLIAILAIAALLLLLFKTPNAKKSPHTKLPRGLSALCVLAPTAILCWPFTLATIHGVSPKHWPITAELARLNLPVSMDELPSTLELLRENSLFEGSSYAYIRLFETNTQRVTQECRHSGEVPDRQKLCLILMTAIAVESKENINPLLYSDIAARAVIVMAIDAMVRVISAEGLQAPSLEFFLSALEVVGLNNEKKDLEQLIQNSEPEDTTSLIANLQQIRLILDRRARQRQEELSVHHSLFFSIPSSVDLGI